MMFGGIAQAAARRRAEAGIQMPNREQQRRNAYLLGLFNKSFVRDATSVHITNALLGGAGRNTSELVSFQIIVV